MAKTASLCLIAFIVAIVLAVILWYRNWSYDRVIAVILVMLGITQLISFGCHSQMKRVNAGFLINFILWFLLIIFISAIYFYTHSAIAGIISIVVLVAFVYILACMITGSKRYVAYSNHSRSYPVWASINEDDTESSLLGSWIWFFLLVVLIGWILLLQSHEWFDVSLFVLFFFVILSAIFVPTDFDSTQFAPCWCYLLIGLGALMLIMGFFYTV